MRSPTGAGRKKKLYMLVATCTAALLVVSAAVLLGSHPPRPSLTDPESQSAASTDTSDPSAPSWTATRVVKSSDPQAFVRAVASALFAWDTTAQRAAGEVARDIFKMGDPTGVETAGLVADVDRFLPSSEAWDLLRRFRTRQWLTIDSVIQPDSWPAVASSPDLVPGTVAYTLVGERHRSGSWGGRALHTAHPVSFTAFVVCQPTYDTCHLLRLSVLDEPLS